MAENDPPKDPHAGVPIMFWVYVILIGVSLVAFTVVGLTHN